ncbi:MAG: DUF3524 domain-containing protein, partial [Deltaproteobacteria bacterium]|nr:DUF3524 domain-containing protein [Deltaproteobacteria bacterium]
EPYYGGSHAAWAAGYRRHSRHRVEILSLPARFWKWRMHGGAVKLAEDYRQLAAAADGDEPGLLLATDMLDLAAFLGLTRESTADLRTGLYFHENQLTYPWSPADPDPERRRDRHYQFINFTSALAADVVLFNSAYHRRSFLAALPGFLQQFPDYRSPAAAALIAAKSRVLPLGVDLASLDEGGMPPARRQFPPGKPPLILWNHRWEDDKNPEAFFRLLLRLADRGLPFRLAVLGQRYGRQPKVFAAARRRLAARIVQWGYVESRREYAAWLHRADILPVTARHDFFGVSVVEALYCRCHPLLPRRLSYPEHVPADRRARYLYDGEADLERRLAALLKAPRRLAGRDNFRAWVRSYDWSVMAPRYDDLFASLAGGNGRKCW